MRIAVQNPVFLAENALTNYNGYNLEFIKKYKPIIYLSHPTFYATFWTWFKQSGLNINEFEFVFSAKQLNIKADVLLCFNGRPDLENNQPVKEFTGMKIYHVMDYVFRAKESHDALKNAGVDYVLGYTEHDKHCPFFQNYYGSFNEKVISVPFGFSNRFEYQIPLTSRINKVIALGSVNPVDDPAVTNRIELMDYINFYQDKVWTHEWRRALVEHENELHSIMDSHLPHFPETKNPHYDAVLMMNRYAMFANDEGLMLFPPARTYEGTASGSVLVSSDHQSYRDLGFINGVNCIMHEKGSIDDFKDKVNYYISRPKKMQEIALNGMTFVRENYSHDKIAEKLYQNLKERYEK